MKMNLLKNIYRGMALSVCLLAISAQAEDLNAVVKKALPEAKAAVTKAGVAFDGATVDWNAINQFNKQAKAVKLPKVMIGGKWLGQTTDLSTPSEFVDGLSKSLGVPEVTVFQRMNDDGDMLRVATTVKTLDGKRGVGTYVPAIEPDGSQNIMISTVLEGKPYYGRAKVVDHFSITGYDAITDGSGKIIGVIFVGVPEK
ncbi:MAG: Cache 3/Cache 2 fusion domain-containing protein [Verrucomicrobiota bacterium]